MIARRALFVLALVAALGALPLAASAAPTGLEQIQKEFKTSLERGTPATVAVTPKDGSQGCSGVMVTAKGLVLSDFDAGRVIRRGRDETYTYEVQVRVPDMKTGTFVQYEGRIVKVLKEVDSTLIQILKPPSGGFKYLVPASADSLHVGSYTFAAGNSFGMSDESLPAMTAGVLAGVKYLPRGDPAAGRFELLFTGAAVNPGVSGGPLLDVQGRLVGVISGYEPVTPDNPYQFLGKAMPIDRIRAAYASVPEAKDAFDEKPPKFDETKVPETTALETVIAKVAADAFPSVASLTIERSAPLNSLTLGEKGPIELPRYTGAMSAVAVSGDGWLVTSLYNLTNVLGTFSVNMAVSLPPVARIQQGLQSITAISAEFSDGAAGEAKIVSIHEGLGIAVLKADVIGRRPFEPAPATAFEPGRFLVSVANPYGDKQLPDPLINFGVVSKRHPPDLGEPWRGQLQTDLGGTDGNCGAAALDVEGKLVGIMTLWLPIQHGRNSGVAFVVPWDDIQRVLMSMKDGKSYRLPRVGVSWTDADNPTVREVQAEGPAATAGMLVGDVIVKLGDRPVKSISDFSKALIGKYAGDRVPFTVTRAGAEIVLDVELGSRD